MEERANSTTPGEARLACIREAVKKNLVMQDDSAPWLVKGVQVMKKTGDITLNDLQEIDENLRVY